MSGAAAPAAPAAVPAGGRAPTEAIAARGGLLLLVLALAVFLAVPLLGVLAKSFEDAQGGFVGLANFATYLSTGAVGGSVANTLVFAVAVTAITVPLAFAFAYAIQRSCIPLKTVWRNVALVPILAPSMLPALSFLYLFGNQGWLKDLLPWFGLNQIYGLPGMVLAMSFAAFPHAVMILVAALSIADARLYEAADALGATRWRRFATVTLPGARYGLVSAAMVVFTMTVSEFGVPKVIGGNTTVLAVDVYKQVVGQQNFQVGAVVSLLLLLPALGAFAIDRQLQRRQKALLTARSVPYAPRPSPLRDRLALAYVVGLSLLMAVVMGMAVFGSFASYWPYNLAPTLRHYVYGFEEAGVEHAWLNSLQLAFGTAALGTAISFAGAYWVEKTGLAQSSASALLRPLVRMLALLPMAVPGLVLGIGYILFFNAPGNPLGALYGTMAILVISTVVHFYSSSHLTAVTALKQLDNEFESVSASLKVPFYRTFWRVTVPVSLPSIIDIARYYFVNAMTTISCVVFLYSPATQPAAVAIVHLDEAGAIGSAAAMATLIVATSAAVTLASFVLEWLFARRLQAWRVRS